PVSAIEFYENGFTETTPDNKTEQKYSSVERISVINNKVIYIHVNNIMSYILPFSCFDSKEQYTAFFQFIKTKCSKIDMY
ncbi:MAG: YcxB family protein, partial [Clostridia bacterium]|nr:YcxB family protein [Clostridia bacterium]